MSIVVHAKNVEMVPIELLVPYERNARKHDDTQIEALAQVIQTAGFTVPLVIDEQKNIVAGHGRLMAADLLGMTEVPCVQANGLSKNQIRALRLADNALSVRSTWDTELARLEITELAGDGFDLDLLGFDAETLSSITLPREDGVNDPNEHWAGMPEFDQHDKTAFRSIIVHMKDQASVEAFFECIGQRFTDKTKMVWYPNIEIERLVDKQYVDDSGAKKLIPRGR